MKKRILAVFLVTLLLLCSFLTNVFAADMIIDEGYAGPNCRATLAYIDGQFILGITGTGSMNDFSVKDNNIAWWFRSKYIDYVTYVIIEEGITHIGDWAFATLNIETLVIPDSVVSIGDSSFAGCKSLYGVILGENVITIEENAFFQCSNLQAITKVPKTLENIGECAFYECYRLNDIHYNGSEADWNNISIEQGNDALKNVNLHFTEVHCKDHTWINNLVESATCTTAEKYLQKCSICGMEGDIIEKGSPMGHKYASTKIENATCETSAKYMDICEVCGENGSVYERDIPLGHNFGEWTLKENGIQQRICSVCGKTEEQTAILVMLGDINNDNSITAADATQILRYVNGKTSAFDNMTEEERIARADVTGDESITAADATQILRHVNGKTSAFDNINN